MGVEKISAWMPVSQQQLDDAKGMRWLLEAALDDRPLTLLERLTGWRRFTSSDGLTSRYNVSWRAWLQRRRMQRIVVETCPYCGCELGPEHDPLADEPLGV